MKPELISFKLCPFVQRSVILMQEKQVDYDIQYINLKEPPDWFTQISPLGKVPLLKVGDTVLFESAVIMEYLDEIHPPSLHPADPLAKAQNRAWNEFASTLLMSQFAMVNAADEEKFNQLRTELRSKLALLEQQFIGPYFNGEVLSLSDIAFAPFFVRLQLLEGWHALNLLQDLSKISSWSALLLQRSTIQNSVVPEFADLYRNFVSGNGTFGGSLFAA